MRCVKCHFLSFEPEARCRNCGHDLSMDDAALLSQDIADVVSPRQARSSAARSSAVPLTGDLPLFMRSMQSGVGVQDPDEDPHEHVDADDVPLVKVPARPRAPVAVRRTTPDPARLRAKYGLPETPEPDLWSNASPEPLDGIALKDEPETLADLPLVATTTMPWPIEPTPQRLPAAWQQSVGGGTRLVAAVIDVALLGGIAAVVVLGTLRMAGLSIGDVGLLPVAPLSGLFLLLVSGYLLMFTMASGQTVGKMAMHIRVVGTSPEAVINDRVSLSQATMRTLASLPSILMLGLGFIPALMGAGLALHDRIAHTRVVRL